MSSFNAPLPTRWLTFWIGMLWVAAPLMPLFYIGDMIRERSPEFYMSNFAVVVVVIFGIVHGLAVLVVGIGLYRRRFWAWRGNWAVLILGWLSVPLAGAPQEALVYFLLLAFSGVVWMWPNAVYFSKRRSLFNPPPSEEPHRRIVWGNLLGGAIKTKLLIGTMGFLLGVVVSVLVVMGGFLVTPEERLARTLITARHVYDRCQSQVREAFRPAQLRRPASRLPGEAGKKPGWYVLEELSEREEWEQDLRREIDRRCADEKKELEIADIAVRLWRQRR